MRAFLLAALIGGLVVATGCGPSTDPSPNGHGNETGDAGAGSDGGGTNDGGVTGDGGEDNDGGLSPDGGTSDGGAPDAGCTLDDPLDDLGLDSNCDGAEGVVAHSIYVSNAGDDIYGGTPEFPVKTLARAAALRALDHSRQYVLIAASAAPYASEGLGTLLSGGATVSGALFREFGWSRPNGLDTRRDSTEVVSDQRGVVAEIASQGTALLWVSLVSTQDPAVPGDDTFGLTLSGTVPLNLGHVELHVGDGANGADGGVGADGPDRSVDFQGGTNTTPEGEVISPGGLGGVGGGASGMCGALSPLKGGSGGDRGVAPPYGGGRAQPGAPGEADGSSTGASGGAAGDASAPYPSAPIPPGNGADGAAGDAGTSASASPAEAWSFDVSGNVFESPAPGAASDGALGAGGGGGGGAELPNVSTTATGGGGAGGGAGGCPGVHGGNGTMGGFSVGIVATGKWPLFTDVEVATGNGGNGGAGGAGGQGGTGGLGGVPTGAPAGGYGGAGGPGGRGGAGVPGNGGWSIGILAVSPVVTPESKGDVSFTLGAPGAPGAPAQGGNPGVAGDAVATHDL